MRLRSMKAYCNTLDVTEAVSALGLFRDKIVQLGRLTLSGGDAKKTCSLLRLTGYNSEYIHILTISGRLWVL